MYRKLDCGHEQVEVDGGEAQRALTAHCKVCRTLPARMAPRKAAEPAPVDTRTELQRLADDVERTFAFPAGRAWGRDVVAVKKLVEAARKHACPGGTPT